MQSVFFDNFSSFYFIGIGGVSMSGLAKILHIFGKKVAGSDICNSAYSLELTRLGIRVSIGGRVESISDYEVVVYTDAVKENDVQLLEARRLNKVIISRGQLLYELSKRFKTVIAVSGCHGKTTATAMLTHIFTAAKKNFAAHIGGQDKKFSNSYYCGDDYFITEACEYKKNFLLLKPDISVVLNTDPDHLECYKDAEELQSAYRSFAGCAEVAIVGVFSKIEGITFGLSNNADYVAKNIKATYGVYSFSVYERGELLGRIDLKVCGKHNVLNALAVTATARAAGISFGDIRAGLQEFSGVGRRFEDIGYINRVRCIADYAHHPKEIQATIRSAKKITSGKIFVVFQPHTYSRTVKLFKSFVRTLSHINNLLIYKTFAAREYFDDNGSALTLSQSVKKSVYGENVLDIKDFVSKAKGNDLILFLGAGDIYDIAKTLTDNHN